MSIELTQYIAHLRKAGGDPQSLEAHLLGVAEIAKGLASKIGLAPQGELIGLLHDLGKYSNEFQVYLKSAVGLINQDEDEFVNVREIKGKVDHSTAGAQLVWQELSKQGGIGLIVGQVLSLCIASHHSGLIDCLSSETGGPVEDNFTRRISKSDSKTHIQEVITKMDVSIEKRFRELVDDPGLIGNLRESIRQLALRDGGTDKSQLVRFNIGLLVRLLFSCLIDADRTNTADFENPKAARNRLNGQYIHWDVLIERLEQKLRSFGTPNPIDKIRGQISDHCRDNASRAKGIYTLTVPTGGGKTLASLRFALHHAKKWKMDRIIYVVPFTTIIDQNAEIVRAILEPSEEDRGRIVLEHHSNLTPEEQGWKEKILTENWDSPVVYTTNVQLLEALFGAGTRGARRMHQLANSVLVFDEVQAIPVNCVHLFNNGINFLVEHCGSTAVLCTATQPLLNRVDKNKGAMRFVDGNEIMPDVKQLFDDLKRVEVLNQRKPGGWTNEEIVRLALKEVDKSGSCLVIVNTRKVAKALFQYCRERTSIPIYHLSTNMCPAHRKNILGQLRERLSTSDSPVICISTQLIEAGVDIDFGTVIRLMAGLDSIAQAAGRCNRHKRKPIGRVYIVNSADENLDMLKDIRCGRDVTERILDEAKTGDWNFDGNLLAPKAMERYFDYYFFARRDEMGYPVSAKTVGRDDTLLNLLSINSIAEGEFKRCHNARPNIYLRQSFMSAARAFKAIDAPTRGVIVPYGEGGRELINELCTAFAIEKQHDLLRKAQQYTVNVFPHELKRLQEQGAVHAIQDGIDILYLHTPYYSEELGLGLTPDGPMEVLCV
ncbi:MAG: CRISPR-associated helicase/endonuclease Cas3 [Nitrospira sp. WS238]|nr:CRISPR-associated helicase/endonuclease Cas3 [Nitrospira sp. WS238]